VSRATRPARGIHLDLTADRAEALRLADVSPETSVRLDRFVALLQAWQPAINLVAPSTLPHLWTRHIADSLQLLSLAPQARVWIDLGSGAGFPGLVIACALADQPGVAVHLVESNGKKAAFLREAARQTSAPAVVHHTRIEEFLRAAPRCDIVTARALAPLPVLLGWVAPLLERAAHPETGAQALLLKGQDVEAELTEASKCWNITASLVPSKTSPDGRILVVWELRRRPTTPLTA
jgi:16S rRNA (guanine527-N7)-methyltransferase